MMQCVDNGFLERTQISATIIAMICSESCRISRSLFKHAGPLLVNGQTVEATPLCPCSWFMKWMGWDGAAAVQADKASSKRCVNTSCKNGAGFLQQRRCPKVRHSKRRISFPNEGKHSCMSGFAFFVRFAEGCSSSDAGYTGASKWGCSAS